uniref:NADH-ubiquinone oxidoreductase chain 5 n=1 Tax=Dermanyssus gallinae TaxID=34641 RepID=A0A7U3SM09_9ACAR|nr:NADH dehydrogenase subunit 5 [Dermanyssus gallinae]QPG86045.1 NADH dehydrogenase subunit 5 [Dermanyssus gallinae]
MFLNIYLLMMLLMFMFLYGMMFLLINMKFYIIKYTLFYGMFWEMSFYVMFDWIVCSFCLVILMISSNIMLYSKSYMYMDKDKDSFKLLMLLFVLSMLMMVLSPDLIMILLGWDGLGLISFCLVIFYKNEVSYTAGMITIMTNRLGDIGMLLSVIIMLNTNCFGFFELAMNEYKYYLLILMLMFSAMTKSAQIPFSSWLPAAMAAPTPVSSLVHSSTLVTAGVYLIIRLSYYFNNNLMSFLLMKLSIMTMMMSGLVALFEYDLKKIVAFSTLNQLSIMMLILSVGMMDMAYFHLLTHALFKALLFMCSGIIIHNMMGWQDLRKMNNVMNYSVLVSSIMFLSLLSLMGFPYLSGFYSKDMIFEFLYMMNNSYMYMWMYMFAIMNTVLYSLRVIYYLFILNNSNNIILYQEDIFMNNSIISMGVMVIVFGSSMMWLIYPLPFFFLTFDVKMLNIILMLMGLIIMISYMGMLNNNTYKYFYKYMYFMQSMWFLNNIYMLNSNKFYKNWYYNIDLYWMESLKSKGIYNDLLQFYYLMMNKLMFNMKYYSMLMLMVMFLILF